MLHCPLSVGISNKAKAEGCAWARARVPLSLKGAFIFVYSIGQGSLILYTLELYSGIDLEFRSVVTLHYLHSELQRSKVRTATPANTPHCFLLLKAVLHLYFRT